MGRECLRRRRDRERDHGGEKGAAVMKERLTPAHALPVDHDRAELVGRVWSPDVGGPVVVRVHQQTLFDLSPLAPTSSELLNLRDPVAAIRRENSLEPIGTLTDILANTAPESRNERAPWLLAP